MKKKNEIDLLANEIRSLKQREKLIEVELEKRDKSIETTEDYSPKFERIKLNFKPNK